MKSYIQNILNLCFAISITFLIYENQQLKDSIKFQEDTDMLIANTYDDDLKLTRELINYNLEDIVAMKKDNKNISNFVLQLDEKVETLYLSPSIFD
tara:strand:- start:159 stop:446 length:288 start_codon:yes stop_codon:yes gene_type:complete